LGVIFTQLSIRAIIQDIFLKQDSTMGNAAKSLINQALELTSRERAIVAEQLLLSLDRPNQEIDEIWANEAEARVEALESGKLRKVSAESVLGKHTT
jgi:hypothetical protein